ncbi:alpha/beta hydrolase [Nisaea acidiphila]|uniref:Alpha/beta hydrolase n=1 Tax=Nisaea acidiphila TaxID=1862145 RepID=A0A9J7ASM2_9PROT|nr:alpha/beta hydrolase [Nisaea acidiphila]UUX50667.1 alpha/beta hydrolase [Nisaea acidiphila]
MLEGFKTQTITVADTEIFVRTAGTGYPVLLIHGFPQTGACWHRIAPTLAERFSVVVPDLRGYGASGKPAPSHDHAPHSKRAMARDLVEVMAALGHERFAVVGHDRGARVGFRLTMDHPERVSRFCSLDVIPTLEMWEKLDLAGAVGGFHWSFLAQPAPVPETLIGADPDFFYGYLMRKWAAPEFLFDPHAMGAYLEAMRDPAVIAGTCEDYRAGAGIDVAHDRDDREAGRKLACPLLFLYGGVRGFGGPGGPADPLDTWRNWCDGEVTGGAVPCGHFLPEEAPGTVLEQLLPFLMDDT